MTRASKIMAEEKIPHIRTRIHAVGKLLDGMECQISTLYTWASISFMSKLQIT